MSFGGAPSTPSQQTITQSNIPDWLRPQVETLLGGAMQQMFTTKPGAGGKLEVTGTRPYVPYSTRPEDYIAGFAPMQEQAFGNVANLQVPGQFGAASGMTMQAANEARGIAGGFDPYRTGQFTGDTMQQYMSPYMQGVVDVQQQAAQRQADIAAQAQKAQFAKSGMFGGSAQAIAGQQAAADLARQKQGIQAQGLQTAYQQAADQFNREQALREQSRQFGAGLGMQGAGMGLQAAGQLGQLGAQQLAAQQGIIGLQSQMGAMQQQQQQNIINQAIQNFAQAQQYPLQQFNAYNALLRGYAVPGQTSTTYQAAPSMASQIGGLGMGAYGMSQLFGDQRRKEGGLIKKYADGGDVVYPRFGGEEEPTPDIGDIAMYSPPAGIAGIAALGTKTYPDEASLGPVMRQSERKGRRGRRTQEIPAPPEDLLRYVMQKESGGSRYDKLGNILTSPRGAMGELQVMPATARNPGFGIAPAKENDPEDLARVGRQYLGAMMRRYNDPKIAAIAYNWGPGNTDKWLAAGADVSKLPKETRNYVAGMKGEQVAQLAEGGIASINRKVFFAPDTVTKDQIVQGMQNKVVSRPIGEAALDQKGEMQRQAQAMVAARQAPVQMPVIDQMLAQGLPGLQTNLPTQMAGGGIVAFEEGGEVPRFQEGGSPAGRWLSEASQSVADRFAQLKQQYEASQERSRLMGKVKERYMPAASMTGLFMNQTDAEREAAKRIMDALPTMPMEQLRALAADEAGAPVPLPVNPQAGTVTGLPYTPVSGDRTASVAAVPPTAAPPVAVPAAPVAPAAATAPQSDGGIYGLLNPTRSPINLQTVQTTAPEEAKSLFEKAIESKQKEYSAMDEPLFQQAEERLTKRQEKLKGESDKNVALAMIAAGARMASTPGSFGVALSQGLGEGLGAYIKGEASNRAAEEKLEDAQHALLMQKNAAAKGNKQLAERYGQDYLNNLRQAEQLRVQAAHYSNAEQIQLADLSQRGLIAGEQIRLGRERIAAGNTSLERAMLASRQRAAIEAEKEANKNWSDPLQKPNLEKQYGSLKNYQKEIFERLWGQSMPQLQYLGTLQAGE